MSDTTFWKDEYGLLKGRWVFAYLISILTVVFSFLSIGVRAFEHYNLEKGCASFYTETGYTTKFVDYTFWRWDCLVKQDNGKFIPVSAIRSESSPTS